MFFQGTVSMQKLSFHVKGFRSVLYIRIPMYGIHILSLQWEFLARRHLYLNIPRLHMHTAYTVYPKKYAHGFCFAVLCCGYTWTDFPISIRLTSLALWQSNDCPSASKATLMNMDKYFMWIHYERLHNHNKAKHNKTVCMFLGIYCRKHTGPFYQGGLALIPTWISNHIPSNVWDEINHPCIPKFQRCNRIRLGMEKWFHLTFLMEVIAYPFWD